MLKIVQILVLILLLSALFYSILSCHEQNETTEPENLPFMIENLGVRFGEWDTVNNTAGDFLFLEISNIKKIVSEFGAEVVAYDGSLKNLPTMDFTIREDAPAFAIAEGEVSRVFYQEGANDWEIGIRSINDPNWEIGYDHLVDLQMEMGETKEKFCL